jgi:hypothetical protein
MNALQAIAFANELEKDAAVPGILSRLWGSHLARSAVGAGLGAGVGALASPEDRLRGAILGAGAGGLGGVAAPLATRAGRKGAGEAIGRWFKAQKHGLTGKGKLPISPKIKGKELKKIRAAEKAGLTSLPGIYRAMKQPGGVKKTIGAAWRHAGPMGKVMALGDVALGVPHIMDPTTQEGYGQKILGTLGSAGGYMLGGRLPFLGNVLLGSGAGMLAGQLGKGVDVLTGHKARLKRRQQQQGLVSESLGRPTTRFAAQQAEAVVPQVGRLLRQEQM